MHYFCPILMHFCVRSKFNLFFHIVPLIFSAMLRMAEVGFEDPAVVRLYNSLVNTSANDPYEDAIRFLEFVRASKDTDGCPARLRLDAPTLISAGAKPQVIERHMKFLLLVQFEYTKSLPSHDPNSIDYELSDWATQILERLSICSLSRSDWKNFIKNDLVDRFASTHGKTLAQIYMDIGLEPPSCLPQLDEADDDNSDDDKVIDDSSSFPALNLEDPVTLVQRLKASPGKMLSPKSAKISARNSLPRALFTDSIVFSSGEGASWLSASQTSPEGSSIASTSYLQSTSHTGREYVTRSKSGTPAPHLVLMPASKCKKSRRKARTPIKRGPGQHSRSPMVGTDSRSRRRRIPSGSHGGSGRRKLLHRSVTETPNPKMSHPRWERARMAAAEKTKGRLVIVAESPLKPSEPGAVMSSPLRRLRRASSLLNFRRSDLSGGDSGGGASSAASTSRLSVKAELWQRRQMEEEASLSQFSGGESNLSQSVASVASMASPQFRRRTSNLMANLISLRSPQSSAKSATKPALSSAVSSPPVLNLSRLKSEFSQPRPPLVPLKDLFQDLDAPSSATTSTPSKSVKTPAKRPPSTGATPKRRKTGPRGPVAVVVEVPTSPHIFDEATMFPGEGEFFQRTATDLQRRTQPLGGGDSHTTPRKCVSRPPSASGGGDKKLQSIAAKRVGEVTPSRLRNPLIPSGNTRSVMRSEAFGEQPVVGGGGPYTTPRKRVLCLHSPGGGGGGGGNNNKESQLTAEEEEGGNAISSHFLDPFSPAANTCSALQSEAFEWSPSTPSTSGGMGRSILSPHQVTTRRITPRKGLFCPTASPLRALSPSAPSTSGAKGRGILSPCQVTTRRTTPRKGLFRPTETPTPPPPRAQDNAERQNEEATDLPKMRLRPRRSLFR